jgi:hypothetical protein
MPQSTSQAWQKAALETLLWLLDPDRAEAEKAYLRLFERLVAFFRSRRRAFDPEELAEQTLTRMAKAVYLRLTGLRLEDLDRADMVHEVPRSIAPRNMQRSVNACPCSRSPLPDTTCLNTIAPPGGKSRMFLKLRLSMR